MCLRSAARSPRACSRIPTGSPSSTRSIRSTTGSRAKADVVVVIYNDHGARAFSRQDADLRGRRGEKLFNADEAGISRWPALPRPCGPVVAHHREPRGRGVRCHDVPGASRRPRVHAADETDVSGCRRELAGGDRPDHDQFRAASPTALRCWKLGQAVGARWRNWPGGEKIVVLATGGLSHQLDGTRAGFINKDFDQLCMDKIVHDPVALTRYSNKEIVELAGSQGVELLCWIAMRGRSAGRSRRCSTYRNAGLLPAAR